MVIYLFLKRSKKFIGSLEFDNNKKGIKRPHMLSNLDLVILSSAAVNENQIKLKQHMGQKHKVYF